MSRGLANNNPGNIRRSKVRYKGEVQPSRDPSFKQFESLAWGYRAVFMLLHTYRVRHGLRTIREMISRWAPPSEPYRRTRASVPTRRWTRSTRLRWFPSRRPSPAWRTARSPTRTK